MKWYRKLYFGDNASKAKYKVFGKIRKGRFQIDTYLICIGMTSGHTLEIMHANFLMQPFYKKKKHLQNIYVVGIAKGYAEALELVRTIVDDTYQNTGGTDVSAYLKFGQNMKE